MKDQRIAVGAAVLDDPRADLPRRAGAVVNHHLLPEKLCELVLKRAGVEVGAAACRERTDEADRFVRVALCSECGNGGHRKQGSCEHAEPDGTSAKFMHDLPPMSLLSGTEARWVPSIARFAGGWQNHFSRR